MLQHSFLVSLVVAGGSFLMSSAVQSREPASPAPGCDASATERRIAELEDQLSSIRKEIHKLRRDLSIQPTVRVVTLHGINAKEARKALRWIYQGGGKYKVTQLIGLDCLIIRGCQDHGRINKHPKMHRTLGGGRVRRRQPVRARGRGNERGFSRDF